MTYPKLNAEAPNFKLLNENGEEIKLKDFRGKNIVLYFYPKALTPGCTTQACGLRDIKKELLKLNTIILGISPDQPSKLLSFVEKKELNFTLLSDPEHKIALKYGVWGKKQFMGKVFDGIHRTTFIIDKKGLLVAILDDFKTKDHHDVVLNYIKENL